MSVPIATSPGRAGFGPRLSLGYDSGAGNGAFGFGWRLSLPSITRKTDQGLPRYLDAEESDVFVLSGAEDLVPVYRQDETGHWTRDQQGRPVIDEQAIDGYRVRRYRPRVEGLFARIERWTSLHAPGDVHWRSISKDNILTIYGLGAESRIADPLDPGRVFSWLICEVRDDKGNALLYRYQAEDGVGVDLGKAHEANRGRADDLRRTANRYLKRIQYGNRRPMLDHSGQRPALLTSAERDSADWVFEVVFDYGDHDAQVPRPNDHRIPDAAGRTMYPWQVRPDPFSSYRAGFEVRTLRRCRRVLMFHHFPHAPDIGRDCLVRSTDFTYGGDADPDATRAPVYSLLVAVTQTGYRRRDSGYAARAMPPIELTYSLPEVQDVVEDVDPSSLERLPVGLDGGSYRWADLHGEGIPGVLTEQAGAWHYKRNLSPIPEEQPDGREQVRVRFAALETVGLKPNAALGGGAELMDLAGDGRPDLVLLDASPPGLYEHDEAEGWGPFRPLQSRLNRDLRDPNVKLVDLDGDGRADVLISEEDALVWHASLGEQGFGPARRVAKALDEETGPRIVFADGTESIYLADLSGDGLTDIARIRNGEVCYWPNLGHGRFGAKVAMDNAPWLDPPELFDHKRIRLADIDGSGTTDIIYLHRDGVRLYFNQSGNGWSRAQPLAAFPRIGDAASIMAVDLLGNGTACLVWSSPLTADATRPMRYVNLMGERKPHLLIQVANNLGAETRITYAPSTKFYLQDRQDGRPWLTRLPFPVHLVERVEIIDHIGRNRFVTRYAYHHGYFDGEEREFRGFGMVEQWDTEQIGALRAGGADVPGANTDQASHMPPVHTKTWYHTGVYLGREHVSDYFAGLLSATDRGEYYREPGLTDSEARALLLPDTVLPDGLTAAEEREACRALKGAMLRQEVYADDAPAAATPAQIARARTPFTVTEQNFSIRAIQPQGANRHAVFFSHAREAISYHYERNPADPRVQHALTLEVDDHGNVLKQAAIGYGRRETLRAVDAQGQVQQIPNPGLDDLADDDRTKQTRTLITYTEHAVTNAIDANGTYRAPLPCEVITFELTGYTASGPAGRFRPADLVETDPDVAGRLRHRFDVEHPYEALDDAAAASLPCRRPIEWVRTLYRRDDLSELLPLGELQSLGLAGESYKLAFTPGLLTQVYRRPRVDQTDEPLLPDPAPVLGGEGGYLRSQDHTSAGLFPRSDADDHWWLPSGRSFFSENAGDPTAAELAQARRHFFLPRRYRDAFGTDAVVDYDANDLLMTETRDALGNRVRVEVHDYRVLQPRRVRDPNGNRTEVAFDTLGLVAGTALTGKAADSPPQGDSLAGFAPEPTETQLEQFATAPRRASSEPDRSEAAPISHDLLGQATTRVVYDLGRFMRLGEPPFAATIARKTHIGDLPQGAKSRLQLTFSYSDGFGREIQQKIQAEPGPLTAGGPTVAPRWAGSGWTVFNNKGKPVRRYEPFFSDTHAFEFGVEQGVSPVLFYDPAQRVVATLHPNHTYEKLVFDPWQRTSYDVNDTLRETAVDGPAPFNPKDDDQVGAYLERLPETEYLPTWADLRTDATKALAQWPDTDDQGRPLADNPKRRAAELDAAQKALAHSDTPTTTHLDTLGRPFLTLTHNRCTCPDHPLNGLADDKPATRVDLDIEGNQRAVRDERKLPDAHRPTGALERRTIMRYAYDMLGNRIHQQSMEAGARWMLNDVAGQPIRSWDSRGHVFTTRYDVLRRPVGRLVRGTITTGGGASDPRTLDRDVLVDRIDYGEGLANAEDLNLRTRVYRHHDSAGVLIHARLDTAEQPIEAYDFKGNLKCSTRRLATDYRATPDWSQDPDAQLDAERFESRTRYDALNRPIQSIAPHSSGARPQHPHRIHVIQPRFNEANLLDGIDVWLERAAEPNGLLDPATDAPSPVGIGNIDYDAKGQRRRIDYKNGASTFYDYDPLTFRLIHLYTRRGDSFTGDCENPAVAGDTTAAPVPPLGPPRTGPFCGLQNLHYTYDPAGNITRIRDDAQQTIYFRNQRVEPSNDYTYDALYRLIQATGREHLGQGGAPIPHSHGDAGRVGLLHPGDGNAMGPYVERYVYDAVGNVLQMQHRGSDPSHAGWTRTYDYDESSLMEDGSNGTSLKQSNRLSQTTLNPNGNGLQQAPYLHDAHGNMVRMPHLGGGTDLPNMHWDYRDQLREANLGGGGTAYDVYDASGERVRKVCEKSDGLIEERIYLGGFEIFRRHNGAIGAHSARLERETLHVMDDKQRIALVEMRTLDAARDDRAPRKLIRYQFGNHLGSSSLELDEQADIISYEEYAPYGSSTYQAMRNATKTTKRYRYTGKERDEETRLDYFGARFYCSWLARWASPDKIVTDTPTSRYSYSGNRPIILTDPTGHRPKLTTWLLTGGDRWEATDEELADITKDMRRTDTNFNTAAGYGALVGVVGVFENNALLGYDAGRLVFYNDREDNIVVELAEAVDDRGLIVIPEGIAAQADQALKGDAVAFGEITFSAVAAAEGAAQIKPGKIDMTLPPAPVIATSGQVALEAVSLSVPVLEGLGGPAGGLAIMSAGMADSGNKSKKTKRSREYREPKKQAKLQGARKESRARMKQELREFRDTGGFVDDAKTSRIAEMLDEAGLLEELIASEEAEFLDILAQLENHHEWLASEYPELAWHSGVPYTRVQHKTVHAPRPKADDIADMTDHVRGP